LFEDYGKRETTQETLVVRLQWVKIDEYEYHLNVLVG
jgi:hypothetical protein